MRNCLSLCLWLRVSGVQQALKWAWTKQQGNENHGQIWGKQRPDMFLCFKDNVKKFKLVVLYMCVCVCERSFNVICVWQSCGKTNTSPEAALHTVMEKTRFGADVDLELLDWVHSPSDICIGRHCKFISDQWRKLRNVLTNRALL